MLGLKLAPDARPFRATTPSPMFVSELLDQIRCGTVYLSVPLRYDIIQVGVRDAPAKATIRVRKWRRRVTVERTDGKPLQVAFVYERPISTGPRAQYALISSVVFHQPVKALLLQRRRDAAGRKCWHYAAISGVTDPRLIKQFVDTIGTFGTAKQRRRARRAWLGVIWRQPSHPGNRRYPG